MNRPNRPNGITADVLAYAVIAVGVALGGALAALALGLLVRACQLIWGGVL